MKDNYNNSWTEYRVEDIVQCEQFVMSLRSRRPYTNEHLLSSVNHRIILGQKLKTLLYHLVTPSSLILSTDSVGTCTDWNCTVPKSSLLSSIDNETKPFDSSDIVSNHCSTIVCSPIPALDLRFPP